MSFATKGNKIIVVGIIGKTRCGKANILNEIIDIPVFKSINPAKSGKEKVKYEKDKETTSDFLRIESHLDSDNNIMYLNLVSIHDTNTLLHMMTHFDIENMTPQEFHLWLENEDYRHMKALLFLFHVCHIILVAHSGSVFDVEYLRVLRILQTFKQMLAPSILTHFSNSPHQYISDFKAASSFTPGKCVPLLTFVFSPKISKKPCKVFPAQQRTPFLQHLQQPISIHQSLHHSLQQSLQSPSNAYDQQDEGKEKSQEDLLLQAPAQPQTLPNYSQKTPILLQKQPQILQPQILQPTQSAPPPSQPPQAPQILAREEKHKDADPMKKLEAALDNQIRNLLKKAKLYIEHSQLSSVMSGLPLFTVNSSFGVARISQQVDLAPVDIFALFATAISSTQTIPPSPKLPADSPDDRSILQLVLQQVKLLLGPPGPGKRTDYITLRVWQTAASTLQELLLNGPSLRRIQSSASSAPSSLPSASLSSSSKTRTDPTEKLLAFLDPDYKYSASRCVTALAAARDQYLAGLPAHYTAQVHDKQLQRAIAVFAQQARGPAAPYYTQKLRDDCTKMWVQGRQLCDSVSLTGRPCVYLVETTDNGSSHPGPHSSGYHTLCACNCGSTRKTREDPFELETANTLFFSQFSECCDASTISLEMPSRHPQWSFVCLGTGAYYQPALGLQQEGFVSSRNFLSQLHYGGAPWLTTSKMGLGNVIRHSRQLRTEHHHHTVGHFSDVISPSNVAYYGYEYECPSGHRFFVDPPKENSGGVLNIANTSLEPMHPSKTPNKQRSRNSRNRNKHPNQNVEPSVRPGPIEAPKDDQRPLFTMCLACNVMAQLQRIFLVSPDWAGSFSIHPKVTFQVAPPPQMPQVRPGSNVMTSPTVSALASSTSLVPVPSEKWEFSPGMEILLPKYACVCLRLPYIYSKQGPNNKQVPLLQVAPHLPYIATVSMGLHIPHIHAHPQPIRE